MTADNLVSIHPKDFLTYGPSKLLVDQYHWHSPDAGIVASYTPREKDVEGHFDIFRGVDQIESFAQATVVSCGTFLECKKQHCESAELNKIYIPAFISIGNVIFHNYLEKGDTFVNIGRITFSKFRQVTCVGRIYKAPQGLDLDAYFGDFDEDRLAAYDISSDFVLVTELDNVTGRALKRELMKK
ncbi:MAG: hypothetical protein JST19_06355 [Bacteroidetes bacterium]|nr:hypothetical protein [Bacteroidota bacterium]